MGGRDSNYDVIYRGEYREYIRPGSWVFIQRQKIYGGGYWFGRVYDDCFWLEFERPASLAEGLSYLLTLESVQSSGCMFDDEFTLT